MPPGHDRVNGNQQLKNCNNFYLHLCQGQHAIQNSRIVYVFMNFCHKVESQSLLQENKGNCFGRVLLGSLNEIVYSYVTLCLLLK